MQLYLQVHYLESLELHCGCEATNPQVDRSTLCGSKLRSGRRRWAGGFQHRSKAASMFSGGMYCMTTVQEVPNLASRRAKAGGHGTLGFTSQDPHHQSAFPMTHVYDVYLFQLPSAALLRLQNKDYSYRLDDASNRNISTKINLLF